MTGWLTGIRLCPPIVGSVVIFPDRIQLRMVWEVTPRSRAASVVVMVSGFMKRNNTQERKERKDRYVGEPEPPGDRGVRALPLTNAN